jgi:hypothetical protein
MDDIEELAARIVVAMAGSWRISLDSGDPEEYLEEIQKPNLARQRNAKEIADFYWRLVEALKERRPSARTGRAKPRS